MAKLRSHRGTSGRRPWRRRAIAEQLEPRLLLSADLPGEPLDAALPSPHDPVDATEIEASIWELRRLADRIVVAGHDDA